MAVRENVWTLSKTEDMLTDICTPSFIFDMVRKAGKGVMRNPVWLSYQPAYGDIILRERSQMNS